MYQSFLQTGMGIPGMYSTSGFNRPQGMAPQCYTVCPKAPHQVNDEVFGGPFGPDPYYGMKKEGPEVYTTQFHQYLLVIMIPC